MGLIKTTSTAPADKNKTTATEKKTNVASSVAGKEEKKQATVN